MIDEGRLSEQIQAEIGYEPPSASFASRGYLAHRISAQPLAPPRRQLRIDTPLVLIAAILAGAIVVTLFFGARALHSNPNVPAGARGTSVVSINYGSFYSPQDGVVAPADRPAVIFMTHDGGNTWIQTPASFLFGNSQWIDAQHFYVWGLKVDPSGTTGGLGIDETADGGAHWRWVPTSFDPTLLLRGGTASFFLSPTEGWSLDDGYCHNQGSNGSACARGIYHTVDAGANWTKIAELGPDPAMLGSSVLFTDSLHGFAGASSPDGVGRYFTTSDGGRSWKLVTLTAPAGGWVSGLNTTSASHMFGNNGLMVDGVNGVAYWVYASADSGLTWSHPRQLPMAVVSAGGYFGIGETPAFLDARDWWAIDSNGALFRTTDAGQSWQELAALVPRNLHLVSVTAVNGQVLWGITGPPGSGFPVRSDDGGVHWNFVKLPGK